MTAPARPLPDPYRQWAEETGYTAQGGEQYLSHGRARLQFIAALHRPLTAKDRDLLAQLGVHVPALYVTRRFLTLSVAPGDAGVLDRTGLFHRLQLATARIGDRTSMRPRVGASLFDAAATVRELTVIGIIDHGIAFAHPVFRRNGKSRVLELWDQTWASTRAAAGSAWSPNTVFGYGHLLSGATIDRLLRNDELGLYRQLDYQPALRRRAHGTHVAALAAGWPDPLRLLPREGPGGPTPDPDQDPIRDALIIGVQMPYRPIKDTSGGSLAVNLLDGIQYIISRAPASTTRIVINVSDGALAGAHSGSSLIEAAIDDLLEQARATGGPLIGITLAAGNAYKRRTRVVQPGDAGNSQTLEARIEAELAARSRHAHAAGDIGPGQTRWLDWRVLPDDPFESYLELWLAGDPKGIEVRLHTPDGIEQIAVTAGSRSLLPGPARRGFRNQRAGLFSVLESSTGSGPTVLAAVSSTRAVPQSVASVAPERAGRGTSPAPHGIWRVEIINRARTDVRVDLFVERNDLPYPERRQQRQSYLVDRPPRWTGRAYLRVESRTTLSSIATASGPVVVGGYRWKDQRKAGATWYSSSGPVRSGPPPSPGSRTGPDCVAPSDESHVLHGVPVPGNYGTAWTRMDGTSAAAPRVARFLATEPLDPGMTSLKDLLMKATPGNPAQQEREGIRRV